MVAYNVKVCVMSMFDVLSMYDNLKYDNLKFMACMHTISPAPHAHALKVGPPRVHEFHVPLFLSCCKVESSPDFCTSTQLCQRTQATPKGSISCKTRRVCIRAHIQGAN